MKVRDTDKCGSGCRIPDGCRSFVITILEMHETRQYRNYMEHIKNTFIILAAVFISVFTACSGSDEEYPEILMLKPHGSLPEGLDEGRYTKIFLAGTIDMGNSKDWQQEVYESFSGRAGKYLFFNPRQDDWNASRKGEMDYQVNWELAHLEKADKILMYITGDSKSPISLLEMGLHMRSGKLVVACEPEYYRYDNVRITCGFYGVALYHNLEEALKQL